MSAPTLSPAQQGELIQVAYGRQERSRTLRELGRSETPQAAHALLLEAGVWDASHNPYPARHGVPTASPELPLPPLPEGERLDLTQLPALAIDDDGNQDPDDALSLEELPGGGRRLWVHVADVAALVTPGSDLDAEARARGASLYLPGHTAHMLPDALVSTLGLGLHTESPALSISVDFAPGGWDAEVVDVQLTRVRVQRVTYREAQARLTAGDPLLRELHAMAAALREVRLAEGAVELDLPEVILRLKEGELSVEPLERLDSRVIVQESMMLAGWAAAVFAEDFEDGPVPLPYATQEPPRREVHGDGLPAQWARRKSLSRTRFQTAPAPHAGLGFELYAQSTSPMRRYLDLVVHQQLRAAVTGGEPLSSREVAARIAEFELSAVRPAERDSRRHLLLAWLAGQGERVWNAVVAERRGNSAVVLLPQLALDAPMTVPYPPGHAFQVRVSGVDLPRLGLNLREV